MAAPVHYTGVYLLPHPPADATAPADVLLREGIAHHNAGRLAAAEAAYAQALVQDFFHPYALTCYAFFVFHAGRIDEAFTILERASTLSPDPRILLNWLQTLGMVQRWERALEVIAQYEAVAPDAADVHINRAIALMRLNRAREAVVCYRRGLDLCPDSETLLPNLIYAMDLAEETSLAEAYQVRRRWNAAHCRPLHETHRPHENTRDANRPLRVGYVSADFMAHSAAYVWGGVVRGHDDQQVIPYVYSSTPVADPMHQQFRDAIHHWRDVGPVSDDLLASRIRDDRIDILVDLSGFTAGHRLKVFARKPAPIQVCAWGYANGTGMDTMDYFFADPFAVRPADRQWFQETVIDLPCIVGFAPPDLPPHDFTPAASACPSAAGSPVTFGSFNRAEKITPGTLDAWGAVLRAVPEARLFVKNKTALRVGEARWLRDALADRGIAPARLLLAGETSHAEHLAQFSRVDVQLDTCPHTGGVTSLEGFWQGVPTVTLVGPRPPERLTADVLHHIGHPEWIAGTVEEYVTIAVRLAKDTGQLVALRGTLRQAVKDSALYGDRYTRAVEAAYRAMWRRWCTAAVVGPDMGGATRRSAARATDQPTSTHAGVRSIVA